MKWSPDKSSTHLTPYSYYSIIDCIPCAVLYIPVTVLWLPICTSSSLHLFHPALQSSPMSSFDCRPMVLTFGQFVYPHSWHLAYPPANNLISLERGPTICCYFNKLPCVILMGQFGDHTDKLCCQHWTAVERVWIGRWYQCFCHLFNNFFWAPIMCQTLVMWW